jgi:MerR family transcriptional regulator, thiopeptide resistance regulator
MTDDKKNDGEELYAALSTEQMEAYEKEARERWGHTDVYRQSQERVKKFSKDDWQQISKETDDNLRTMVGLMLAGKTPDSPEVQAAVDRHHAGIERFYDCSPQIYRGLADVYLADQRFADLYRKYHKDLPEFLVAAMRAWCDKKEKRP